MSFKIDRPRVDQAVQTHAALVNGMRRLRPEKTLDAARRALREQARPTRQRMDGTRPRGKGQAGSVTPSSRDPLAQAIDLHAQAYLHGLALAKDGLQKMTAAEEKLRDLASDTPYYKDGARQCRGYQRLPHKTTKQIVDGFCRTCYEARRYRTGPLDEPVQPAKVVAEIPTAVPA